MKWIVLHVLLQFFACFTLLSQQVQPSRQHGASLGKFLKPDGTLQTPPGFSGSLDPAGWKMKTDIDGTPRFERDYKAASGGKPIGGVLQSGAGDEFWDSSFAFPQVNGYVLAIAIIGSDLYIGGSFTTVGKVSANFVARWDGSSWSPLGNGMSNTVRALAVSGTNLYAGGDFRSAGSVAAYYIAAWNGSNWSPLGSGLSSGVSGLAIIGSDLYAGGSFTVAGGAAANYIARWNGSSWSPLGNGMNNQVRTLAVSGTSLYAGGDFTSAGSVVAHYIAAWDGSSWSAQGIGMNFSVTSLAAAGSTVYAGGVFTTAGGNAAIRIAKWDGSNWSALGSGMDNTPLALLVVGTDLYAGGVFRTAGGAAAGGIARWDGSSWHALGNGVSGVFRPAVYALAVSGSNLYAGGDFTSAGNAAAGRIARWDGTTWFGFGGGNGFDNTVRAFALMGSDLYIGGDFVAGLGMGSLNRIVRWNGSTRSSLGTGMNGTVNALAVSGGNLYAGGEFTAAGGVTANSVARWDGSSWHALGTGLNNTVYALAASGSIVYAGGFFTTAGGVSAHYIAQWDGSSWSAMGSGMDDTVLALAVNGSDLYAGGSFKMSGGLNANYVARWNGSSWSALGTGAEYIVHSIVVSGSNLYAGGLAGTDRWDGAAWSYMYGGGAPMVISGSDLYAGGNGATRWNGATWSGLGSGTNGAVYALLLIPDGSGGNSLYAGGSFTIAGGKASSHMARWDGPAFNVAPSRATFGKVEVGTNATDTIVVTNTGVPTLEITGSITTDTEFSVSPATASIPHLGSQKFFITFAPASPGAKIEYALISTNMSAGPTVYFVRGTGGAPTFVAMPENIYYGYTPPHTVRNDTVKLKNTGTDTLHISSVSTSTPDLSTDLTGATIAPGDSTWFHVTFSPPREYIDRFDTITFVHNAAGSPYKFITYATNVVLFTDTVQEGWNLVSVPVWMDPTPKQWLYPNSVSRAFTYNNGYQIRDSLTVGPGYWLKYDLGQMESYGGGFIDRDTIDVRKGWNLVGSITSPVSVGSISSIPGGIVTSRFFGYRGSYQIADSIRPGEGYWVKTDQNGRIVLASTSSVTNKIHIVPTSELPPPPPNESAAGKQSLPNEYALAEAYPNPFNPSTTIEYQLPSDSRVSLRVYNLLGQVVATLENQTEQSGYKQVRWNASSFASGIYFYRLEATVVANPSKTFTSVKKMLLLR